jgi:YVTN family beta-propeller protein
VSYRFRFVGWPDACGGFRTLRVARGIIPARTGLTPGRPPDYIWPACTDRYIAARQDDTVPICMESRPRGAPTAGASPGFGAALRTIAGGAVAIFLASVRVGAGATSTPVAVAPDGAAAWVVNPDSATVARIDTATRTLIGEYTVGRYPRTVAVSATDVYVASQLSDSITRLGHDGVVRGEASLAFGCAPYAVVLGADDRVYVSCQGPSTIVVLDRALAVVREIALPWPEARALATGADGLVYVTYFITKEPNADGHVSEVDAEAGTVRRTFAIPPDFSTCETLGSGQGVANLLSAIAVMPANAPAGVAGQLWVGGTLHNALRKGLFQRSRYFAGAPGARLFPQLDFQSNPAAEGDAARRNVYRAALHDVARSLVWKIDLASGAVVGKVDVDRGGMVAALGFSADGRIAYAVDLMFNSLHLFRTERGQGGNPGTIFGAVSAFGPGGADPTRPCTGTATDLAPEDPFILAPQAQLVPAHGMEPLDAATHAPIDTGLEFTVATGAMRGVPDGVGTTPIGLALSPDGGTAYVANYLARNVTIVDVEANRLRCQGDPTRPCATRLDCADLGECMPRVHAVVRSTSRDPLPPEILDGKILFTTSARDAAGAEGPIPPFNRLARDGTTNPGEVTSTARAGASLACVSCHPDFGGNDGRTWDFSQFNSSLRNTMDLRGRASFAPGTCKGDAARSCTTDAECGPTGSGARCLQDPVFVPPNILPANRERFFNPMGSAHWNGDRDEVEDFEFTFRELMGASDCDGAEEKPETCVGALVVRRFTTDPVDVRADLGQPNRNVAGAVGDPPASVRLTHLADFVYSLTEFPRNPQLGPDGATPSAAAARGRALFNDPVVACGFCHLGPSSTNQHFTDKRPNPGYDPRQTPRSDLNSPFVRHDVGTANVFDETNPFFIASDGPALLGFTVFQNEQIPLPGNRATLNEYLTTSLPDAWNTAPFLHDGSAPSLLDVVRPCSTRVEDCFVAGRGRNVDDRHGATSFLSARQLNDLVAFQKAPHGPIVEAPGVEGAVMGLARLKIRFGRTPAKNKLLLKGTAQLRQSQRIDPLGEPVTVSIGRPAGEAMAIFARTVPAGAMRAAKRGTAFTFKDPKGERADGVRALVIKIKNGRVSFQVEIAGVDLGAIRAAEVDYTIALEIGNDTMGVTRHFRANRAETAIKGP